MTCEGSLLALDLTAPLSFITAVATTAAAVGFAPLGTVYLFPLRVFTGIGPGSHTLRIITAVATTVAVGLKWGCWYTG